MDAGAKKLLETVTIETLHAHHFSRASTQATNVLTDLLSRYLTVLSSTCAKYAEHAGRLRLTAKDAANALDELGVGVEELSEYCTTEGREMSRYTMHTARRLEDLNEFKAALSIGLREDRDDAVPLEYGPVPDDLTSEEEVSDDESESEEELATPPDTQKTSETLMDVDPASREEDTARIPTEPKGERISSPRPLTPPLPLSPISNPSTPPRKRPRTSGWSPPPHIPDFLPPFPDYTPRYSSSPPPMALPPAASSIPSMPVKVERPLTPPPELASITSADYRTPMPYSMSMLASQSTSQLPMRPISSPPPIEQHVVPEIQPSLYQAYHYALTHPPPKDLGPTNPARYKVAVALMEQTETNPRWEPVSSLYGISIPNAPRVNAIGPTHAIPLADEKLNNGKAKETEEMKFPLVGSRHLVPNERVAPLVSQQGTRYNHLTKKLLPVQVYNRVSRLGPPNVLSQEGRKLTYGPGINAPWNSGPAPPATPALPNGAKKDKEKEGRDAAPPKVLPDAKLYATWNWEQKSTREPVRRARGGSVQLSGVMNGRRSSLAKGEGHS